MKKRAKTDAPPPLEEALAEEVRNFSEDQKREVEAFGDRQRTRPHAPRVKVKPGSGVPLHLELASALDNVRMVSAFATADGVFADFMLAGIVNAACPGGPANQPADRDINQALAAVTGIGARDETEAMLAVQMVATHFAAMTLLRRLKGVETIPQQESAGRLAIKLLRTYAMQMEALQRYRGKGQQKVTVEHVHIHPGGQAIVGTMIPGGGGTEKFEGQAHEPRGLTYEPGTPMWSPDAAREALPVPGSPRKTPL